MRRGLGQINVPHQRGLVLLFALIALVALSLAAAALIRTVDTGTLIAGNLAFKQAATNSADTGVESAMGWLNTTNSANSTTNVLTDPTHPFNVTDATRGYYSNADPALDLFADATWNAITAVAPVTDSSGNTIRYIIQRMCRTANTPISTNECLFSGAVLDNNGQHVLLPQDVCQGSGCPPAGAAPMNRITARVTGPRNTVSYVQAFVY